MTEYWLSTVYVDSKYKIDEIKLVEVTKKQSSNTDITFENRKIIHVTKEQLQKMFGRNPQQFQNIKEVDKNSITVIRKSNDVFEFEEIDKDEFDNWPVHLLLHNGARDNSVEIYDSSKFYNETTAELEKYIQKAKMLGTIDDCEIDIPRLRMVKLNKIDKNLKMPPVREISITTISNTEAPKLETIVFSKYTIVIKFPFSNFSKLRTVKLGENTRRINSLIYIDNLEKLDIGGLYAIPSLHPKAHIDELIVSTKCKIYDNNICEIYHRNIDIKQIKIVEIN